jgi:pimeloyl-ACP methyl ester carboxylesterase
VEPSEGPDRWEPGFLQVADGALIHYRHLGCGRAVLLCDGIGCQGFAWRELAPALASHHLVIHPHLRGHGRSPPPPDPERVSIDILADDAMAVLQALGHEDAILAGHSMGVQTCLEAYRRHPERVRAVVLICGSYGSPLRSLLGVDLGHHLLPLFRLLLLGGHHPFRWLWRRLLPTDWAYQAALQLEVNGELIRRRDLMDYLANLARVEPDLFLRMLAYAEQHSARDLLEQIAVPVLVVGGQRDGFTPVALAREMASRIPGARLLEIPEGTHAAPLERPELVTPAVERFIEEIDGAVAVRSD